MAGTLKWDGPKAQALIAAKVKALLTAAAVLVVNRARKLLSVAGTAGGGKGRKKAYGARPSAPGDPPAKQTGRLRASVAFEVDGTKARVGTNVTYGRLLELGTRSIAPRPWLRRALLECLPQIRALFAGANAK